MTVSDLERLIQLLARLPGLGPRSARRAERGPRPGSLASCWIRRSISVPVMGARRPVASHRQVEAGRQVDAAGELRHLFLGPGLDLALGVGEGGDDQILEHGRILGRHQ